MPNPKNKAPYKRRFGLALLALVLLLPACRKDLAKPGPLNSERIEQRFGSYGVRLLEQDGPLRVARLLLWPDGSPSPTVAVLAYELWVERGELRYRFARIAEAYDPAYLGLDDLRLIEADAEYGAGALEAAWPDLAATLAAVLL